MGRGAKGNTGSGAKVSLAELKKHSSAEDAWIVIDGKVYDVSNWNGHPGGNVIFTQAGQDATDPFVAFHGRGAYPDMLKRFEVGELELSKGERIAMFEQEYRDVYAKAQAQGLFEASMLYYAWKVLSTTGILGIAIAVTLSSSSFWMTMLGAFLVGLFFQQCGWLAHDFAHHQVFKNRRFNDAVVLMVGNLYQGFSVAWWKNKHNRHHAIPNLHETEENAHDGDPDIDTLPFLAWSTKIMRKTAPGAAQDSALARFMVQHQALIFFPLLLFARVTWALQSLFYVFDVQAAYWGATAAKLHYPIAEKVMLILHYTWYALLVFAPHDLATAVAYLVVSNFTCGLLLALAFAVGHNGMTIYDVADKPGFAELQITTTRNVDDNPLVGWFMGGLHYQIEHHLFPTMPRHNLRYARAMIEPLCKKYKIPYHSTGLTEGTIEVVKHLHEVTESLARFPAI